MTIRALRQMEAVSDPTCNAGSAGPRKWIPTSALLRSRLLAARRPCGDGNLAREQPRARHPPQPKDNKRTQHYDKRFLGATYCQGWPCRAIQYVSSGPGALLAHVRASASPPQSNRQPQRHVEFPDARRPTPLFCCQSKAPHDSPARRPGQCGTQSRWNSISRSAN